MSAFIDSHSKRLPVRRAKASMRLLAACFLVAATIGCSDESPIGLEPPAISDLNAIAELSDGVWTIAQTDLECERYTIDDGDRAGECFSILAVDCRRDSDRILLHYTNWLPSELELSVGDTVTLESMNTETGDRDRLSFHSVKITKTEP